MTLSVVDVIFSVPRIIVGGRRECSGTLSTTPRISHARLVPHKVVTEPSRAPGDTGRGLAEIGIVNIVCENARRRCDRVRVVSDMQVKIKGTIAIVTGTELETGKNDAGAYSNKYKFTDVLEKVKGQWQITATQATSMEQ